MLTTLAAFEFIPTDRIFQCGQRDLYRIEPAAMSGTATQFKPFCLRAGASIQRLFECQAGYRTSTLNQTGMDGAVHKRKRPDSSRLYFYSVAALPEAVEF